MITMWLGGDWGREFIAGPHDSTWNNYPREIVMNLIILIKLGSITFLLFAGRLLTWEMERDINEIG